MPGAIPHLIAGISMFIIGRYYFKNYFDKGDKSKKLFLLAGVCISFSFMPDFVLIIYYITNILPFDTMCPYHTLVHLLFIPIAIVFLFSLAYLVELKRKPIWIMGMWSILLHVTMDFIIPDTSIWI